LKTVCNEFKQSIFKIDLADFNSIVESVLNKCGE